SPNASRRASKASVVETLATASFHAEALGVSRSRTVGFVRPTCDRHASHGVAALLASRQRIEVVGSAACATKSDVSGKRIRPTPLSECVLHRAGIREHAD